MLHWHAASRETYRCRFGPKQAARKEGYQEQAKLYCDFKFCANQQAVSKTVHSLSDDCFLALIWYMYRHPCNHYDEEKRKYHCSFNKLCIQLFGCNSIRNPLLTLWFKYWNVMDCGAPLPRVFQRVPWPLQMQGLRWWIWLVRRPWYVCNLFFYEWVRSSNIRRWSVVRMGLGWIQLHRKNYRIKRME